MKRALHCLALTIAGAGALAGPAPAQSPGVTAALRGYYLEAAGDPEGALSALRDAVAADPDSAELRLSVAQMLAQSRKFEEALEVLEAGLGRRPGDPQLPLLKARILEVLGRREEAARGALDAASRGAGDEAYALALRLLKALGRPEEVEQTATRWAAASPKSADAHVALGQVLAARGDSAGARAELSGALEISPADGDALRSLAALEAEAGRADEAASLYRKLVEANPHDAEARFRLAQLLVKEGKTAEAEAVVKEGQKFERADPMLPLRLALLALQADRPADAEAMLRPYVASNGEDSRGRYLLGVAILAQERYQEALDVFEQIPAGSEEYPDTLIRRAASLDALKRGPEALKLLQGWLGEHPDDEEMALALADLHAEQGNPREGAELLERFLAAGPSKNSRFYFVLGTMYDKLKDWRRCAEYMKRSLELRPDDAQVLNYLGYTYADQGVNLDEAEKLVLQALALRPDDGAIVDSLGWVYYRQGRFADAVRELRRATGLIPKDAIIWEHLGDALKASGDGPGALAAYEKAAAIDPKLEGIGKKIEEVR